MNVADCLALAAAALRGDPAARLPLADAMEAEGMAEDAARLRLPPPDASRTLALAAAAIRGEPRAHMRLAAAMKAEGMAEEAARLREIAADLRREAREGTYFEFWRIRLPTGHSLCYSHPYGLVYWPTEAEARESIADIARDSDPGDFPCEFVLEHVELAAYGVLNLLDGHYDEAMKELRSFGEVDRLHYAAHPAPPAPRRRRPRRQDA